MKTAVVVGATGLVGNALTHLLLQDSRIAKVRILVRKPTGLVHSNLEEYVVDFDQPDEWKRLVRGEALFSCLGTTIRKAGSQEAQYKVDYKYQFEIAQTASRNGVLNYALVSSSGASVNSKFFYPRMKGELERDVLKLNFNHIHIIRPGMLCGPRKEFRLTERMAIPIVRAISLIPGLKKYKPIEDKIVAKALINAVFTEAEPKKIYELEQVFELAGCKL